MTERSSIGISSSQVVGDVGMAMVATCRSAGRPGSKRRGTALAVCLAVIMLILEAGSAFAQVSPSAAASPTRMPRDVPAYYDRDNPDYARLQNPGDALAELPTDRQGYVDWMRALAERRIDPRGDLKGLTRSEPFDLDIVMRNTREMPPVVFPHRSHTLWLDCSNCHPSIFEPKAGAHRITMADIFRGRYCGVCHDRVAFITFFSCDRCHRLSNGGRWTP